MRGDAQAGPGLDGDRLVKTPGVPALWAGSGPSVYERLSSYVIVIAPAITGVIKMVLLATSQNKHKHCFTMLLLKVQAPSRPALAIPS